MTTTNIIVNNNNSTSKGHFRGPFVGLGTSPVSLLKVTIRLVCWLAGRFSDRAAKPVDIGAFRYLLDRLSTIASHKGYPGLIGYLKDLRLAFMCYLDGSGNRVVGVPVDVDGFPLVLRD